ncbi:type II toxin-antitoxin system RelE/ParE family toxin [Asticcacaulis sp. BYS171W]|uniref:Type II toxin-antitoxin system RelE/ParE family toxin n=1 Tax=Asticcacaulis aquaticus TaxID=2984212 RepID=A0ABT5HT62_9CAUL|nr:type II toxin-antitoxin system RelE/ParE family toxin [Asticcacaulis aquaticus]MDC7683261.1 type II toxin-antitoxin system RelE/ParE family toxin [Asticcacaulis aquaticus]
MISIQQTDRFSKWLKELKDGAARVQILRRLKRLQADGNPGDYKSLGDGVSEMRIHSGPGYRLYFTRRGEEIVILLCGGDKGSQDADIRLAKDIAKDI